MDLYSILSLSRSCSKEDIKKAFRKKAVEHHPDRHAHASPSEQRYNAECFRAASEAHDVLSNDAMREVYNRSGRTAAAAAGGFPSGGSGSGQRGGYSHSGSYAGRGFGGRNTYQGQGYAGYGQGAQYQARAPRRSFWQVLNLVAARSTRGDALFHALIAGVIVGGAAFAGGAGDLLWLSNNQGKLFEDVQRDTQRRAEARRDADQQWRREQQQQLFSQQQQRRQQRMHPSAGDTPPLSSPAQQPQQQQHGAQHAERLSGQQGEQHGGEQQQEQQTDTAPLPAAEQEQGLPHSSQQFREQQPAARPRPVARGANSGHPVAPATHSPSKQQQQQQGLPGRGTQSSGRSLGSQRPNISPAMPPSDDPCTAAPNPFQGGALPSADISTAAPRSADDLQPPTQSEATPGVQPPSQPQLWDEAAVADAPTAPGAASLQARPPVPSLLPHAAAAAATD